MPSEYISLRDAKFTWHKDGFMVTGFVWDPEKMEKSIYISHGGISCFSSVEKDVFDYISQTQRRQSALTVYTHNGIRISASFDEPLAPVLEKLVR